MGEQILARFGFQGRDLFGEVGTEHPSVVPAGGRRDEARER